VHGTAGTRPERFSECGLFVHRPSAGAGNALDSESLAAIVLLFFQSTCGVDIGVNLIGHRNRNGGVLWALQKAKRWCLASLKP
jgi:hypothetical protein